MNKIPGFNWEPEDMNTYVFSFSIPVEMPNGETAYLNRQGSLQFYSISSNSCEVEASCNGWSFQLIVGKYTSGHYVCVPNWHRGAPLSGRLTDQEWNYNSLCKAGFEMQNAYGIASALDEVSRHVDF